MAKSFDEYVKERQVDWTPDVWAVYDAASVAFHAESERLRKSSQLEEEAKDD